MRTFAICFLLTLGCFINSISAQSDSLITELEKTLQSQIDALGEEHLDIAMYCDSLGELYIKVGKNPQADSLFNKALDIKIEKLEEKHPDIADSYTNLGKVNYYKSDYEKAIRFYNKALNIRLEVFGKYHPHVAKAYGSLGVIYSITGDYEKAIRFYNEALNIRLEVFGEYHLDVAKSYNNLGIVYRDIGDYEKAISFHNKALNIGLNLLNEKHPYIADYYNNLGILYLIEGYYKKAISFHNKALNIRLEVLSKNDPRIAHSYGNIGNVYEIIGNYEKAIVFYSKTLKIGLEVFGENHPLTASTYDNLGLAYRNIGDYEKAISSHFKSLNIRLDIFDEKHPAIATSYSNLGIVYQYLGDYEKAIDFLNKSLSIELELYDEKHPEMAVSYDNLGLAYKGMGDYEKAIDYFNRALEIRLEIFSEIHPDIAISYNGLGSVYSETGDYKKAIIFYDKALNIDLEAFGKKHPDVLGTYKSLAIVYEKTGNYKTADSLWQIAIPQNISQLKSTYLFLSNEQRIKYSNTLTSTNTDFYSFTAIHGTESTKQLATNFLLNTKSLALDYGISTNQLIQEINDTTLSTQHQQLNKINKQLADAETLTIEEREEKGWDLAEMRDEQEALAFQMLQHPQLKSKLNTETVEWQYVQNSLEPDEVTIDFLQVYEREDSLWTYYALVIRDTQSPQFVQVTDEKTLNKLLEEDEQKRLRFLYDSKTRKALHKTLWQPLESYLEGVKTVHISPSGALHRVPFECFQDEADEYLAAQYAFHYHSAIRDILKEKPQQNTYEDMLVMGHILYDLDNKTKYQEEENAIAMTDEERNIRDGIRPLPATLKEVKKIGKTAKKAGLKTTLLTIDAASEDTLQYFVGGRAPSIMHFATHGVFLPSLEEEQGLDLTGSRDRLRAADNPLQRSALMLYGANETWTKGRRILGSGEDGILTALEVTALDLQNTNLVVLSACSTGLGNIHNTEGVFGLQRAFKLAGVDYVVASLWAVDDTATKELMVRFYENLLRKKQDPATALRNAKEKLRKDGYASKYWAGFILIE